MLVQVLTSFFANILQARSALNDSQKNRNDGNDQQNVNQPAQTVAHKTD